MGHLLRDPSRHVLGCGVEGQDVVEVLVVELLLYATFHNAEVDNHAVFVERLCLAHDGYLPVVAVQLLTLAFVVERDLVTLRYLKSFFYIIHVFFC